MNQATTDRGFTLIELVMVMLLIGLMANIVIPLMRPEKFRLDSASIEVASTLTAQQRNAVLRQHDVVMAFDTAQRRIRVHYDADNDGDMETGENWYVVELGEGVVFGRGGAPARPMSPLDLSMSQEQDDLPALTFHRNGSASEEAIIYITSERAGRSGGFPEDTRAVEVERATGRVTCYSYASGSWVQSC